MASVNVGDEQLWGEEKSWVEGADEKKLALTARFALLIWRTGNMEQEETQTLRIHYTIDYIV